ncbi:metalloprotease family protein [Bacillus sp. N9]
MHCWKSFHIDKRYYFYRRFIISTLITLFVFIMLYVPMQIIATEPLKDHNFLIFLCALIVLYPIHKFFHLIPIMNHYEHIKFSIDMYFYILPIINVRISSPIPKRPFLIALLFPFIVINSGLLALAFLLPQYIHYITILLAYHTGMSAVDIFM